MSRFRKNNEQPNEPETIQSDSGSADVSAADPIVEQPIPKVVPEAGLFGKLFVLQHTYSFAKDSSVNAGRMNYKFTSLAYWWGLVQKFFERNRLYVYWETLPHGTNSCAVTGVILDLDSNERVKSTWVVPLTHKNTTDKDGAVTSTTDMLKDGAYFSYFQRRLIFAMCGLITGEDAEAELEAAESSRDKRGMKQTTAASNNNVEQW